MPTQEEFLRSKGETFFVNHELTREYNELVTNQLMVEILGQWGFGVLVGVAVLVALYFICVPRAQQV